jgi:hypothetical protein
VKYGTFRPTKASGATSGGPPPRGESHPCQEEAAQGETVPDCHEALAPGSGFVARGREGFSSARLRTPGSLSGTILPAGRRPLLPACPRVRPKIPRSSGMPSRKQATGSRHPARTWPRHSRSAWSSRRSAKVELSGLWRMGSITPALLGFHTLGAAGGTKLRGEPHTMSSSFCPPMRPRRGLASALPG